MRPGTPSTISSSFLLPNQLVNLFTSDIVEAEKANPIAIPINKSMFCRFAAIVA